MAVKASELQQAAHKFNEIFSMTGLELQVVLEEKNTKTSVKASKSAPALETKYVFEDFEGPVHTYILKDGFGKQVKSFKFLPKDGKERTLSCAEGETIQVLDFKNTAKEAINGWQVNCCYPGIELKSEDIVNAGLSKDGDFYTIKSVIANARIPAGSSLDKKVIYKVKSKELAIAHDFKLKAASIPKKVPDADTSKVKISGKYDYVKALSLMPLFFEANISGKKPDWSRVKWRGDATTNDGKNQGFNSMGGYYDAGDMLVLLNTTSYSFSNIAFSMHFDKKVYEKTGQFKHYLNILRHATDYCISVAQVENDKIKRFAYWVPNPSSNSHNEWEVPEKSRHGRDTLVADKNNPASECAGGAAACLALSYLVFKDYDSKYADKCLSYAKKYFDFGNTYQGKYKHSKVYKSNHIHDELCWGASCLYLATGENWYKDLANKYFAQNVQWASWFPHIDNSSMNACFLLSKIDGNERYHNNIRHIAKDWIEGRNGVRIFKSGLRSINQWATVCQGVGTFGLLSWYSRNVKKEPGWEKMLLSQVNYMLGENEPKRSYLIGYGNNYPKSPHHRGSAGHLRMDQQGDNKHELTGALIGGPKNHDWDFPEDGSKLRSDWVAGEVEMAASLCGNV